MVPNLFGIRDPSVTGFVEDGVWWEGGARVSACGLAPFLTGCGPAPVQGPAVEDPCLMPQIPVERCEQLTQVLLVIMENCFLEWSRL